MKRGKQTKICPHPKCIHGGKLQPVRNFNKDKRMKDGLNSNCKSCCQAYNQAYMQVYRQRPEVKAYNQAYMQVYRQRPEVKAYNQAYMQVYRQRPEVKAYKRVYRQRPEVKAYWSSPKARAYVQERYTTDTAFKLRKNLRARLGGALRAALAGKTVSHIRHLGCTIPELIAYLEARFQPGMTWGNWGRDGWHIDHIKPLASFDLSNPAQARAAVHYTNLQPLWAKDNLAKGDSVAALIIPRTQNRA